MGITSMLLKQKLVWGLFLAGLAAGMLNGCKDTVVNFKDFLEKPTAKRTADKVEITLGYTAASANWIDPIVTIEKDQVLVAGTLTFKERKGILSVQLPDPTLNYHVYWVDKDGARHEIEIKQ